MKSLFNRQNEHRAHALASLVRVTIFEQNFWHRCQHYVQMVEENLKAVWVFDGWEAAMERAWITMDNLKKPIFNLWNPPFNLPACIAVTLEENLTKRWDMILTDLHYRGVLLNPYLKDVLEIQESGDAKRALNRMMCKLCAILGIQKLQSPWGRESRGIGIQLHQFQSPLPETRGKSSALVQ